MFIITILYGGAERYFPQSQQSVRSGANIRIKARKMNAHIKTKTCIVTEVSITIAKIVNNLNSHQQVKGLPFTL